MPDDPFIQKKRPILTPFQRENRKIQGVGQKRKVRQTLEFTGLFWRRVRDSNPRFLLGTRHFECRTFDLSDNSPYTSSVILAPEECKKNTQERYEIVKSEPAQSPVRRTFSADETAGASKNFECCKTLADSRLEQVVSGHFVKRQKRRRRKGLRTFRPVSAGGDLKCPRVQIKLRSCVKSRRSCAFARSQARKQRPRQHR